MRDGRSYSPGPRRPAGGDARLAKVGLLLGVEQPFLSLGMVPFGTGSWCILAQDYGGKKEPKLRKRTLFRVRPSGPSSPLKRRTLPRQAGFTKRRAIASIGALSAMTGCLP